MGISTIQSYRGAQIFEAVGLEPGLIDRHFTGTPSRIGGVGLDVLATEALERHARAYPSPHDELLPVGGVYAWRRDGEHHIWNPETIALVQHAVRAGNGNVGAALKGDRAAWEEVRQARPSASTASTPTQSISTPRAGHPARTALDRPDAGPERPFRSSRSSRPARSSGASAPAP